MYLTDLSSFGNLVLELGQTLWTALYLALRVGNLGFLAGGI